MPTGKDTIELLYNAFQENPNRLTYSTEKLQKQYNASQSQVQKARKLYRINPLDFVVAQAVSLGSDKFNECYYDSIPASELFETLTGEKEEDFRKKVEDWANQFLEEEKNKKTDQKIWNNLLWGFDTDIAPQDFINYSLAGKDGFSTDKLEKLFESRMNKNANTLNDNWEVKQKWVKNKETGESSLLVRKTNSQDIKQLGEQVIQDMTKHSPKYGEVKREKQTDPHLLVLPINDIHLGKLSVAFETGQEYNRRIAVERTLEGVQGILNKTSGFNIDAVLLIIGNDILHTDTKNRTTTQGTFQDTEGMWHENFLLARDLYVRVIEMLVPIADVYVQNNQSNHDEMSGFFLAETVKTWFRLNENVFFDITPKHRKYFQYGQNLIGTSHGDCGKEENLPLTMADEAPEEWGQTKFRYWYLGHIHHKKSKEYGSVCIEYVRSPSPPDSWHDKNQYLNTQAMEGFIHSLEKGQVCRITNYF